MSRSMTAIAVVAAAVVAMVCVLPGVGAADDGLVAEWHFDEGSGNILGDSSGNENNGIIYGATWTAGKFGSALNFDGSNDYVNIPTTSGLNPIDGSWTVEAWINIPTSPPSDYNYPVMAKHDGDMDNGYALGVSNDGTVYYLVDHRGGPGYKANSLISTNTWYHVAGVLDRTTNTLKIFVNGSKTDSTSISGLGTINPSNPLWIGRYNRASRSRYEYFNGTIDEVRIYNRALTADEIKEHYGEISTSDGFDYPVGSPYVTQANDGDGWYNAQDFRVNNHLGEDWNGEGGGDTDCGEPVYAVSKGTIVYAADAGSGWGNVTIVRHELPDGTQVESLYGHLQSMNKTSGTVERREQIGTIGKDGWPYCHLHFELRFSNCSSWGSPGPGYSTDATGWTDPSDFIDLHRPPDFPADWAYSDLIMIQENSGLDLTDYQIPVELNALNFDFSKAQLNGADIRFVKLDDTLLSYWIEEWDSTGESAKVWVKVPSIPTNGIAAIRMYYGNSVATSKGNGSAVFEFFDDFSTDTLANYDLECDSRVTCGFDWDNINEQLVISCLSGGCSDYWGTLYPKNLNLTNLIASCDFKVVGQYDSDTKFWILTRYQNSSKSYMAWYSTANYVSPFIGRCTNEGVFVITSPDPNANGKLFDWTYRPSLAEYINTNTWYNMKFAVWDNNMKLFLNDIEKLSCIDNNITTTGRVGFRFDENMGWIDNIIVRQYISPEPTVTVGYVGYFVGQGAPDPATKNHFIDAYNRNGGLTVLGSPTTEVHRAWGYLVQDFPGASTYAGGIIMYNPYKNYAYYIHGAIWERYYGLGGPMATTDMEFELGPPVSDIEPYIHTLPPEVSSHGTQFRYQHFEGGALEHNIGTGEVFEVHGAIFAKWGELGYASGELGLVTSDEREAILSFNGTTGRVSDFENGHLHWHSSGEHEGVTYVTCGELDDLYVSIGGTASWLGFPVMDQEDRDGHGYCGFEGGYIEWDDVSGEYKALDFPTHSLTEDIELTVSKTQDHLDGIMDEVQWCAEDGDYFSEKLEGDMRDIALDFVVDTVGVASEVPKNNVDLHKIAFTGGEDTLYAHLIYLKHDNEYARDLFRDALLNRNFGGAGEVLKGASYYFAADFADESIDAMAAGAFKISYKLNLEGDLAMQEKFVPALENAIERVYKTDLDDTKSIVLQNIPEFTSDQIELYEEDLTKRRHANLYLIDHMKRQNLMLHHTQDITESEEGDWIGKTGMFLAKYSVKLGVWFLFDGPGVLVTELAECTWNVYENNAELNTDAQMMDLAIASNNNAFDTSRRIYTNTLRGLTNIENGVTPQIARGNIESIDNLVLAEYVFWGENDYAFVTDAYSEVTIKNTGTSTTDYLLTAKYGVWGLLGTSYTPMTVPAELKIGAGKTNTIRVKYYEDGKYGECPSDGTYIQFDLLGQTDTGLYHVGTASTNFYPHIPYTTSTKFGTTKIVTSKDSVVSQEEMAGAEMHSYPVRSVVKAPINSTNYTLEIYVENPFDVPISVTLSQEMPNDTEIINACNGTIDEKVISWNIAIEPEGCHIITVIFRSHDAPGVKVEVPPVEMGIYDPINENVVDFQTNLYEFETKFPLRIMAFPPTNAPIGEEIIVPINITSLLTDNPFSGNITLELVNSDNDAIYNLTEGFSLAPGETQAINLVASPEIDPAIYIIKGTLQGTEASMNIFKEYISVDACYVIGTALLQNRYNHNGTEVKLGNYNATTQPDGSYIFVGIPVDTYSLTISHPCYLDYNGVVTVGEGFNTIPEITLADITPPASIANLNSTIGTTWINWTWTNPTDTDFNHTMVYLNGIWQTNTSDPFHNAAGLSPNASYEIGMHTVDTSGNVNTTWVNQTTNTTQKGDLNSDGSVTPADAAIALHIAATGAHDDTADVSGDGRVTSLDALMIMQAAAGGIAL